MTKSELIALIAHIPDDAEIVFEVPSHNYWGQMIGKPITDSKTGAVAYSRYLEADQILSQEQIDEAVVVGEEQPGVFGPNEEWLYEGQKMRSVYILY